MALRQGQYEVRFRKTVQDDLEDLERKIWRQRGRPRPIILPPGRFCLRQEDCPKFEASQGYTVKLFVSVTERLTLDHWNPHWRKETGNQGVVRIRQVLSLRLPTADLMLLGERKAGDMGLHALGSGAGVKLSCVTSQCVPA